MSIDGGVTVFDRLRGHFEDAIRRCPDCGHREESGEWHAETSGGAVTYRYACTACGATHVRRVTLG